MFCNFCGKNFESMEGFEDVSRSGQHLVRCEKCIHEQREEEYDWRSEHAARTHPTLGNSSRTGSRGRSNQGH